MRELEMKERSSKSLLANVLDLDDDFRRENNTPNFHAVKIEHDTYPIYNTMKSEMQSILKELKFLTDKVRSDEDDAEEANDWKFAAMVIDRLCLWVFTLFTVISTFAILFSAPHILT